MVGWVGLGGWGLFERKQKKKKKKKKKRLTRSMKQAGRVNMLATECSMPGARKAVTGHLGVRGGGRRGRRWWWFVCLLTVTGVSKLGNNRIPIPARGSDLSHLDLTTNILTIYYSIPPRSCWVHHSVTSGRPRQPF